MSREVETKFLSCLFQASSLLEDAKALGLGKDDFTDSTNQRAYLAMLNAKQMGVYHFSKEVILSAGIESVEYDELLSSEFNRKKNQDDFEFYTKQMIEHLIAVREQNIIRTYQAKIAKEPDYAKKSELREEMYLAMGDIVQELLQTKTPTFDDIIQDMLKGKLKNLPVSTGFEWLDNRIAGGFYTGLISIIAAESGHGKSLLMKNCAVRQALPKEHGGLGMKVLILSMELTKEFLAEQMMAILMKSRMKDVKFHKMLEADPKVSAGFMSKADKLGHIMKNLYIEDGVFTPQKVARRLKQAKKEGIQVVYIDYFQHLDIDDKGDGNAYNRAAKAVTSAVKEVKDIAVVVLSQVTGEGGKAIKTPNDHQTAKLRYAKQLLNDTAVEILSYRNERPEEEPEFENENEKINLYIRKNRMGVPEQLMDNIPYMSSYGLIGTFREPDVDKIIVNRPTLDPKKELEEMRQASTELPQKSFFTPTPDDLPVNDENDENEVEFEFEDFPTPWD